MVSITGVLNIRDAIESFRPNCLRLRCFCITIRYDSCLAVSSRIQNQQIQLQAHFLNDGDNNSEAPVSSLFWCSPKDCNTYLGTTRSVGIPPHNRPLFHKILGEEGEPAHQITTSCSVLLEIYDGCTTYCDYFHHLPVVGSIYCYINAAVFAYLLL